MKYLFFPPSEYPVSYPDLANSNGIADMEHALAKWTFAFGKWVNCSKFPIRFPKRICQLTYQGNWINVCISYDV